MPIPPPFARHVAPPIVKLLPSTLGLPDRSYIREKPRQDWGETTDTMAHAPLRPGACSWCIGGAVERRYLASGLGYT